MIVLRLKPEQLNIISAGLVELPYRIAAPLIADINAQIQSAFNSAVDDREGSAAAVPPAAESLNG